MVQPCQVHGAVILAFRRQCLDGFALLKWRKHVLLPWRHLQDLLAGSLAEQADVLQVLLQDLSIDPYCSTTSVAANRLRLSFSISSRFHWQRQLGFGLSLAFASCFCRSLLGSHGLVWPGDCLFFCGEPEAANVTNCSSKDSANKFRDGAPACGAVRSYFRSQQIHCPTIQVKPRRS